MITRLVNKPWKFTVISEIIALSVTAVVMFYLLGEVATVGLVIAFICSGPLAYVTSSITFRYQKEIKTKSRRLESLTEELLEANQQLQISNAELDAYAHTVAHDLKNPLLTLMGATSVLQNKRFSAEQQEQATQIIVRTGQKMDHIIQELLLLSTLREANVIKIEPLDMADILDEAKIRLTALQEEKQAIITYPESWPTAKGYAPWIEAVWTNYLSNAIKYGGKPPKIELGATLLDNDTAKFWVHDNGAGLTLEEQNQLFTPFERLTQSKIGGHGLGLSIVQRIVNRLDGEVGVESNGEGSLFFFTLPLINQ